MKTYQLKKLIREVIREVEKDIEEPSKSTSTEKDDDDDVMKHSREHEKQYGDVVVKLSLSGINKNSRQIVKDFIAQAAWDAKMADLEIINAELEKGGKSVLSIDEPELKGMSKQEKELAIDKELEDRPDVSSVPPGEMPPPEVWRQMSPEQRDKFIKRGSHEDVWKAATEKDIQAAREKAKRGAAMLAAGTLETDPETGLPLDTTLWTDKEWDEYYAGQGVRMATSTGEKTAGKQAYRPRFSRSQMSPELKKQGKAAVPANISRFETPR